jgi:hypothetical protein
MDTLEKILDRLQQAKTLLTDWVPDKLDEGAEALGHIQSAMQDAATFLRGFDPTKFLATKERTQCINDLKTLKDECDGGAKKVKGLADNPVLRQLLLQFISGLIDKLLNRLGT